MHFLEHLIDKSALLNREEATEKYICVVGIIGLKSCSIRELSEEMGDLSQFISLFHHCLILFMKIQGVNDCLLTAAGVFDYI